MSTSNDDSSKQTKDVVEQRPKTRGRKKKVVETVASSAAPQSATTNNTSLEQDRRNTRNPVSNDEEDDEGERQGGRKYITLEEYRNHLIEDIFQVIHTKMNTYFIEYFKYISIYHEDAVPGSSKWKHLMERVDSFRKLSLWYQWYTGGDGDFNDPIGNEEEDDEEELVEPTERTEEQQQQVVEPEPMKRTRRAKKSDKV